MKCPKCGSLFTEDFGEGEYICQVIYCRTIFIKKGNRYYVRVSPKTEEY